jgi:glycosyltransferase involved in cell wall biosynthesis
MKLIIQIPCLNEESTLPLTLAELPRYVEGVDVVEWLVIDDGSTDNTACVARECGVDYVVSHTTNKGLAAAFQTGLNACLERGADIIVNTDADNQYPARYIPQLIEPILRGYADIVIGDHQTNTIEHFSTTKKVLQKAGTTVVRRVAGTEAKDAPSGFRAFSREAAMRINILSGYTYTLDTIIQAGKKNLTVAHIPIKTNPDLRRSRLVRSIPRYVLYSAVTIVRLFALYQPLRTFTYLSLPFFLVGGGLLFRFLLLVLMGQTARGSHIQSVAIGSALFVIGFLIFLIGIVGDLIATNRRLHEETLYYLKHLAFDGSHHSNRSNMPTYVFGNGMSLHSRLSDPCREPSDAVKSHQR